MTTFIFTDNHKTEINDYINDLYGGEIDKELKNAVEGRRIARRDGDGHAESIIDDIIYECISEKNDLVERMTEEYYKIAGEMPSVGALDRLSTWIQRYVEHDDEEYDVETPEQTKLRQRRYETTVPEVYNDEFTLKKDGNRVNKVKPSLSDEDEPREHSIQVMTEYDFTEDKRKYNSPVVKT